MTIHAAKGLEFDTVFLRRLGGRRVPVAARARRRRRSPRLEEERRLAYVAITRARRRATILHAANRRIYGQWTSRIPSRFVAELPEAHIDEETHDDRAARACGARNWSERADPFADVARGTGRGPGWQRAAGVAARSPAAASPAARREPRVIEARASAVSLGNKGRTDLALGQRVFHQKFGYGTIAEIEGNKLEIDFEQAGRKRVLDSFVTIG